MSEPTHTVHLSPYFGFKSKIGIKCTVWVAEKCRVEKNVVVTNLKPAVFMMLTRNG